MDIFDEFLPLAAYENDEWDAAEIDPRYDEFGIATFDQFDGRDADASIVDIIDARYGDDAVAALMRLAIDDDE